MPWQRVGRWHRATLKNAINNIVLHHPDSCIYNVSDLLPHRIENNLSSIQQHAYTTADNDQANKLIPRLDGMVGTMKLHETFVQYENDRIKKFARNNSGKQAWQITIKIKAVQMPTKKRT